MSVSQEFRTGMTKMAWFCCMVSGPQLGKLKGWGDSTAGGWTHLEVWCLTSMSGGWCWVLGLWGDLSWGCWSVQVTSLCGCLDFLTAWWLNSKSKCPKRTRHKCMVFLLSWTLLCWKSHRVISVVLTGWGSHKGPPRIKEGWHGSYLT